MGGARGLGARGAAGAILDGQGIALVVAVVASVAHWD